MRSGRPPTRRGQQPGPKGAGDRPVTLARRYGEAGWGEPARLGSRSFRRSLVGSLGGRVAVDAIGWWRCGELVVVEGGWVGVDQEEVDPGFDLSQGCGAGP